MHQEATPSDDDLAWSCTDEKGFFYVGACGAAFVAKYDRAGNLIWRKRIMPDKKMWVAELCADNLGGVYVYCYPMDSGGSYLLRLVDKP